MSQPNDSSNQAVAWKLLLIPALIQLALHVFTNGRYGIFRDEYYYLACATRPAWGYVDQPPLSIWILTAWKSVFGDSIHSLRVLPALCGSALIMLTGAIAAEMGGRRWAQVMAGTAAGIGAAGLVICGFYSMNAFDFLFWAGAYLMVVRIARTGNAALWPALGVLLGVGLMNKLGLLVFGEVLVLGLLLTPLRRHFRDRRLWLAGGISLLFLVPYALWNAANNWATLEFISNATLYKISDIPPMAFLSEVILEANPVTVPLWVGGLAWLLFARRADRYRIVGLMFMLTFLTLNIQKSKPYYFAGSLAVMMAAGAVAWEQWTSGARWQWVRWVWGINLIVGLVIMGPIALPVLEPPRLANYMQKMGIIPDTGEVGHDAELPQYFADRFGWEELARVVSEVYLSLPEDEREKAVVIGENYGHAGALEYWSRKYDLPPVASPHNNYWLWGLPEGRGEVIIAIEFNHERHGEWFDSVEDIAEAYAPYSQEGSMTVGVCRGLRLPLDEVWERVHFYI